MTADLDALGRIMASTDVAMVVVTGHAGGEVDGCLVGFQGQVSIEPLRWGVWIAASNHSAAIIPNSSSVVVHFLTADQHALAEHFGSLSADSVDKFAGIDVVGERDGAPLIAGCDHYLVGRPVGVYSGETDHACVVLDPTEIVSADRFEPLRLVDVLDVSPGHPLHSDPGNDR